MGASSAAAPAAAAGPAPPPDGTEASLALPIGIHVLSKLLFILKLTFCEDIVNVLAGELGNDLAQFFLIGINTDAKMEIMISSMKNKTDLLDILVLTTTT